jgi:uncharacterized metal-binding protein YceD (DUF177 family)
MKTQHPNPPEFSRGFAADRLSDKPFKEHIEANEAEREALAKRLNIAAIKSLEADFVLQLVQPGDVLTVNGTLKAEVVQNCVVTLENFVSHIEEEVKAYFAEPPPMPKNAPKLLEEDIPLDDEHAPEPIPANGEIDLGELTAQHLLLALDPYPRKPGAEFKPPAGAGEETRNPFAVLAEFRDKKKK